MNNVKQLVWIEICFQPWCNPLSLTGLKTPTNYPKNSLLYFSIWGFPASPLSVHFCGLNPTVTFLWVAAWFIHAACESRWTWRKIPSEWSSLSTLCVTVHIMPQLIKQTQLPSFMSPYSMRLTFSALCQLWHLQAGVHLLAPERERKTERERENPGN